MKGAKNNIMNWIEKQPMKKALDLKRGLRAEFAKHGVSKSSYYSFITNQGKSLRYDYVSIAFSFLKKHIPDIKVVNDIIDNHKVNHHEAKGSINDNEHTRHAAALMRLGEEP